MVLAVLLRGYFRVRLEGLEEVPRKGPLVLAVNHVSALDPIIVAALFPRPVHFMAKEELFRNPLLGQVMRWVYAFPVRRGEADRQAVSRALELLRAGRVVGIFPEGTRSLDGQLGRLQGGAAWLALKGGAPVLPALILGTQLAMPKGVRWPRRVQVRVRFGRLMAAAPQQPSLSPREKVQALNRFLAMEFLRLQGQGSADEPISSSLPC